MTSKSETLAADLMRSYRYVRRFVGLRFDDDDGVWILSQPDLETADLADLAPMLLARAPTRRGLAEAVAAREVFEVTAGSLGKGWFHMGKLGARDQLRDLVAQGVRPLRSFRGRDLDEVLDACRAALEAAQAVGPRSPDLGTWLGRLFGEAVGEAIEATYLGALRSGATAADRRRDRLAAFVETAEHVAADLGPPAPELRMLWTRLAKLPVESSARARGIVTALREFAGGDNPHELGRRRSLESAIEGLDLAQAARKLADLAEPEPSNIEPPDVADPELLLELAMRLRGSRLAIPHLAGRRLQTLVELSRQLGREQLVALWPALRELDLAMLDRSRWMLAASDLPGPLLAEALELNVLSDATQFDNLRGLRSYLDVVRRLRDHPVPNVHPGADWLTRSFRAGQSWEPSFVLGVLASHHGAPETLIATLSAAQTSGFADLGFAAAIAAWDDPHPLERPPEAERVAELLDLTSTLLDQYLHWRDLAGYGATFSDAVKKPAFLAEAEERELQHLRDLEPTGPIRKRIAALENPDLRALRLDAARRRARNAFDRALEVLRRESLEAVLQKTTRDAFERLLGRRIGGQLPERIRSVMLLLSAENVEFDALRALLEDVVARRDLTDRPANRAWLDRMTRQHGLDAQQWCAGVDVTLQTPGGPIRFQTETDPLHALEMGSYFDTCLSLEDGFNAASTLTNAVDVNKQVLYGRRDDGTVVARKLIAATDQGVLLGYRTYAFQSQVPLDAQLGAALAEFAERCGLRLGEEGAPTALHETFWYDDGVQPWRAAMALQIPDDVPGDELAASEWAYREGFRDPTAWAWGANQGWTTWTAACAGRLWMEAPELARTRPLPQNAWGYLTTRGCVDWIGYPDAHPWSQLDETAAQLPADAAVVRDYFRRLRAARPAPASWSGGEFVRIAPAAALLEPQEVAGVILDHVRLARDAEQECFAERHDSCLDVFVRGAADVLHASWLRHGPGDVGRLFESRDPIVARIAVAHATRLPDPDIARRVRAIFKQTGPDGAVEWALARQGDEPSWWLLRSALEANPGLLTVAAALASLGDADLEAFARETVELPRDARDPGLIRDLRLDELPPSSRLVDPHGHSDEELDVALAHAHALREAPRDACVELWSALVVDGRRLPFAPSPGEQMRLTDALFRPVPSEAALRYHFAQLALLPRVATLPFYMDPSAAGVVAQALTVCRASYLAIELRHLFAAIGEPEAWLSLVGMPDSWETRALLGPEPEHWRRYLDVLFRSGDTRRAMSLCGWLSCEVAPEVFDTFVDELLQRHADACLEDAAGVLDSMLGANLWDQPPYRLVEKFVRWAGPRLEPALIKALRDRPRGAWLERLWASLGS